MLIATVAGRIARIKEMTQSQDTGAELNFHIYTRPFGYLFDVFVVVCVRGKRAYELAEVLDDDSYVTCVGGISPWSSEKGAALHMIASKVEVMGFAIDEGEEEVA